MNWVKVGSHIINLERVTAIEERGGQVYLHDGNADPLILSGLEAQRLRVYMQVLINEYDDLTLDTPAPATAPVTFAPAPDCSAPAAAVDWCARCGACIPERETYLDGSIPHCIHCGYVLQPRPVSVNGTPADWYRPDGSHSAAFHESVGDQLADNP